MFHRVTVFLTCVFFLFAVIFGTEQALASVSEEFSESTSRHIVSTGSAESSTEVDSTSSEDTEMTTSAAYTTTVAPIDEESHAEEPKLPVDLLSEDILLDPNIVLARLARDSDSRASSSEYLYRRPLRRTQQDGNYRYNVNDESSRRDYVNRKLPIYPVFPGKK